MGITPDSYGHPGTTAFHSVRRIERDLAELLGVVEGMLADGVIDTDEVHAVRVWSRNHPDALVQWPVNLIFSRLQQFFAANRIDEGERAELCDLLRQLVTGTASMVLGYKDP